MLLALRLRKSASGRVRRSTPVSDFNVTAYSGLWYENRRLKNLFELGVSCVTARYSTDLGGYVSVITSGSLLNVPIRSYGYARLANGSNIGSFSAGYPESKYPEDANYNVIEVDYDRYAVIYYCSNMLGNTSRKELLWLTSRQPKLPDQEARRIIRNLMRKGIFQAYEMQRTDQLLCPGRDDSGSSGVDFIADNPLR